MCEGYVTDIVLHLNDVWHCVEGGAIEKVCEGCVTEMAWNVKSVSQWAKCIVYERCVCL